MATKESWRQWALAQRLNVDNRPQRSALIIRQLRELPVWQQARSVLVYLSHDSEVITHDLIRAELARGEKQLLVPLAGAGQDMAAAILTSWAILQPARFGILAPPEGTATVAPATIDLVIVPGVAFDRQGCRLGRGGGYYDRFLARCPQAFRIGLTFAANLVDELPCAATDIRVSVIISEAELLTVPAPAADNRA